LEKILTIKIKYFFFVIHGMYSRLMMQGEIEEVAVEPPQNVNPQTSWKSNFKNNYSEHGMNRIKYIFHAFQSPNFPTRTIYLKLCNESKQPGAVENKFV
jgi:hypothetical protein